MSVPTPVIREGKELLARLQQAESHGHLPGEEAFATTLDNLEAQKQVKRSIQYLENRVDKLKYFLEDKDKSLSHNLQYEDLQRDIKRVPDMAHLYEVMPPVFINKCINVVNWILGPGEKLLASRVDIGDSYEAADELRKRHEELEIKCTDTYGQYAELRHRADEMMADDHSAAEDIRSLRDYMDTVCRSFASRLERRRILLITSVRFHRLSEEFSQKLDNLLELLCSEIDAENVDKAEEAIQDLQDKCDSIDAAAQQTLSDGQSLLDEMSRPIKNAFEDLQERKMRCDELADVRKLKLQQILQLRTCERDADQAIDWIFELCDVMTFTHKNMGRSQQEVEVLQEEHKKFEATAAGTYDYGKQLLQAAIVLRRSLRFDLQPNNERAQRLEEAWKLFTQGTSERANRLTVSAMFLASADKLFDGIENLLVPISQTLSGEITVPQVLQRFTPDKNQVENDFQDTHRMGKALIDRLSLPVIIVEGNEKRYSVDDQGAGDMINGMLRKLERKLNDLNRYWSEMQHTMQPPAVLQQGVAKKRQANVPIRTQTFSHPDRSKESQPSKMPIKRTRRANSDIRSRPAPDKSKILHGPSPSQPIVKETMQRVDTRPVASAPPGSRSGSQYPPTKYPPQAPQRVSSKGQGVPPGGEELRRQLEEY
ncbi:hypothetical protein KUTeg_001999 [Tegillarca granosa]|uniref:SESTD1-like spectrin repeats region domain-containing protein n=1 Tax=Tegillarca granosa TaxID=220873 RepID=A0ABQ9FWP8_TEGGR|nr:hypothetical protein KUTeg_001999 [Tegillarca granosa]